MVSWQCWLIVWYCSIGRRQWEGPENSFLGVPNGTLEQVPTAAREQFQIARPWAESWSFSKRSSHALFCPHTKKSLLPIQSSPANLHICKVPHHNTEDWLSPDHHIYNSLLLITNTIKWRWPRGFTPLLTSLFLLWIKNKHPEALLNRNLWSDGRTHVEGGRAVLSMVCRSAWPQPSTASCLSSHRPGTGLKQALILQRWSASLIAWSSVAWQPSLKYTDPDIGSGDKGVLRPSQFPPIEAKWPWKRSEDAAYSPWIQCDLERSQYLCDGWDLSLVNPRSILNESDLLLFTSLRVDCTKSLDWIGHRRIFWKWLGHKQTLRPCLGWRHCPRIAQNPTQSKVTWLPTMNRLKSRPLCPLPLAFSSPALPLTATCPTPPWPPSSPHSKPHQHFGPDSNVCLSYSVCLEMPFHTTAASQRATPPSKLDSKRTSSLDENNNSSWNS